MVSIVNFSRFVNPPNHNKICFWLTGLSVSGADRKNSPKITKGPVGKTSPSWMVRLPGQVTWAIPPLFHFGCQGRSLGPYPRCFCFSLPGLVTWAVSPLFALSVCQNRSLGPDSRCFSGQSFGDSVSGVWVGRRGHPFPCAKVLLPSGVLC